MAVVATGRSCCQCSAISATSSLISFRSVLFALLMIACSRQGTAANAINDVNNMLRDSSSGSRNDNAKINNGVMADLLASTTSEADVSHFGGAHHYGTETRAAAAALSNAENKDNNSHHQNPNNNNNNNNNNNDNNNQANIDFSVDVESSINDGSNNIESGEMLRFVDDVPSAEAAADDEAAANNSVDSDDSDDSDGMLPLRDQVRLLTKQLNALMMRRREDYELLERHLRKSLRLAADTSKATATNAAAATATAAAAPVVSSSSDVDIRSELEQLRHEVQVLRDSHPLNGNKEKLTIDWLTQSIAEIRKQLVELQQIASDANKDIGRRTQSFEDLATMRSDFRQLKLELAAMRERQQRVEVFVQELREEMQQQEEDYKRLLHNSHNRRNGGDTSPKWQQRSAQEAEVSEAESEQRINEPGADREAEVIDGGLSTDASQDIYQLNTTPLADHRRRHSRFQRQQIHELQLAQRDLKRQLNELKYHRIAERVRSIEIEQHRIADANFNLSRQIASLDKLHTSMLELLEDVEGLQNKVDKSVPELRHEISKLEFSQAQLNSEQSLLREEGKNVARSVQAMAVSVSALQEERDGVRVMQQTVQQLRADVERAQSGIEALRQTMVVHQHQRQRQHQHRVQKLEAAALTVDKRTQASHQQQQELEQQQQQQPLHPNYHRDHHNDTSRRLDRLQSAENLMTKLENVELQYESLISNLPHDCSAIESTSGANGTGLYLIAPAGQHRPIMAHCDRDGWTTVQRRYDGSADFNRSWEDYAGGFGSPSGEYWIGNEQLHALTQHNCSALRIRMQDIYDNVWSAEYARFYVSPRSDGYRLHIAGYAGNASDALDYQQGMQFSAIDVDRDISQTHCAANYEGGWWFSHCQHANLNGRYNLGLTWFDAARNEWIAVKSSQMLVKRLPAAVCALTRAAVAAAPSAAVEVDVGDTTKAKSFESTMSVSTPLSVAVPATAAKATPLATATKTPPGDAFVAVDEVSGNARRGTSTTIAAVV